jgi:hypothetical protein
MVKQREAAVAGHGGSEQEMRDQEVLRANRELAAYFKGRRTGREARAALKIIKAFVRHRERQDAKSRPPLPGTRATPARSEKPVKTKKRRARGRRESSPAPSGTSVAPQANGDGSAQ